MKGRILSTVSVLRCCVIGNSTVCFEMVRVPLFLGKEGYSWQYSHLLLQRYQITSHLLMSFRQNTLAISTKPKEFPNWTALKHNYWNHHKPKSMIFASNLLGYLNYLLQLEMNPYFGFGRPQTHIRTYPIITYSIVCSHFLEFSKCQFQSLVCYCFSNDWPKYCKVYRWA